VPYKGDVWLSNSEIYQLDGKDLQFKYHNKLSGTGYGTPSLAKFTLQDGRDVLIEGHTSSLTCIDLATKRHMWEGSTRELKRIPAMLLQGNILFVGAGGA
jgi:hypothetical protein